MYLDPESQLRADNLTRAHPETPDGAMVVSNAEMSNFPQGLENQGIARRRTNVRQTRNPVD